MRKTIGPVPIKEAKRQAYLHFFPECGGKCREGWVMHHKNPALKYEDPKRYKAWNIEDLEAMTNEEHCRWHAIHPTTFDFQKYKEALYEEIPWLRTAQPHYSQGGIRSRIGMYGEVTSIK